MASAMRDENPIQLLEEAVHLLRRAPAAAVAAHLAGSVPFLVGFLFFVTDMSRSREAVSGCVVEALGMAALFIWMVCWKAVFAGRLRRELEGTAEPGWTLRRACRLIAIQGCAQGVKLFVLPAALLALVPAAGATALFRNITALVDDDRLSPAEIVARSRRQAAFARRQNWFALGLLLLFTLIVFVNVAITLAALPSLLRMLTGWETMFSRSGASYVLNSTFFAVAAGITWLCVDPVLQAFYVLRCFVGQSVTTGEDLRAGLRKLSVAAAVAAVTIGLAAAPKCDAAPAAPAQQRSFHSSERSDSDRFVSGHGFSRADRFGPQTWALPPGGWRACKPRANGHEYGAYILVTTARANLSRKKTGAKALDNWTLAARLKPCPDTRHRLQIAGGGRTSGIRVSKCGNSRAAPARQISADALDRSFDEVLTRSEYRWRLPRPAAVHPPNAFVAFTDRVIKMLGDATRAAGRAIERFFRWLRRALGESDAGGRGTEPAGRLQIIVWALAFAAACLSVLVFLRFRRRARLKTRSLSAAGTPLDLSDEALIATQLPEDGWLAMAQDSVTRGEYRLALRALFLASLAHLARHQLVTIHRAKSNGEYEVELRRRSRGFPEIAPCFRDNRNSFERGWYGLHDVTPEQLDGLRANFERIRTCTAASGSAS